MIRPATANDTARLVRTISRAFAEDPVMRWLFPDDEDYLSNGQALMASLCRRWQHTETQWCTPDGVAVAGWSPPGRPPPPDEVVGANGEHPPWRLERFHVLVDKIQSNTPPEPHWYLNVLATHPDWQRQGLGAALMGIVFATADEAGLACYLETETIENVAYYRRHGFEVRSEWDVPLDGPHMWGMLRQR